MEDAVPIPDYKPTIKYFRFISSPIHTQGGVSFTPLMGEVAVDKIYSVSDPVIISILSGHDEWESATKKDFDAQSDDQKENQDEE